MLRSTCSAAATVITVWASASWACSPQPWSADPCRRSNLPACYYDWTAPTGNGGDGNGVILSDDGEGNEAPATLPFDWVKERVTFMDLQAAREWAAREGDQQLGSLIGEAETADTASPAQSAPDPWIEAASANLDISMSDRLKASNLFHEFQRLDWWSDYSDDGDVRYREMIRSGNALDQLKEFAGSGEDHAYLASRIYDKTAPEEFMRPSGAWYVPADAETMAAIDAKAAFYLAVLWSVSTAPAGLSSRGRRRALLRDRAASGQRRRQRSGNAR
jgi:hypothetical protein